LHSCLYTAVPTLPSHSEVHLKFRTDLHIDLLGQSAEQNVDNIALYTRVTKGKLGLGLHTVEADGGIENRRSVCNRDFALSCSL
jgi:hypothetical protein